jgi:hypothetical protein
MTIREELTETWFGEGMLFRRLIIRNNKNTGEIDGILIDPLPSYIAPVFIDLSHARTLDEAIDIIRSEDFDWYDALTLQD